jgi:hypothetical protein
VGADKQGQDVQCSLLLLHDGTVTVSQAQARELHRLLNEAACCHIHSAKGSPGCKQCPSRRRNCMQQ